MNFILDADIRSYFDSVNQAWLIRFLKHRINDPRIIRLIRKWRNAGILEDGVVTISETGTGQGSVASPLLANVYLHYVFDLWGERWRRREVVKSKRGMGIHLPRFKKKMDTILGNLIGGIWRRLLKIVTLYKNIIIIRIYEVP